jgi:hypothetical protein
MDLMSCRTTRRMSRKPADLMSMYGVTSSEFRSNHAISIDSVPCTKTLRTNTFADNECIFSIVVQTTAGLHRLCYLVFACFFVPARSVSAIF